MSEERKDLELDIKDLEHYRDILFETVYNLSDNGCDIREHLDEIEDIDEELLELQASLDELDDN